MVVITVCVCVCVCLCVCVCVCVRALVSRAKIDMWVNIHVYMVCIHTYIIHTQSVPGGMCQTSGECSLCQTIPI